MAKFIEVIDNAPRGFEDMEEEARAFWDNAASYFESEEPEQFWSEFENAFSGVWDDEADFAHELADSCGLVPDGYAGRYFDYEAFERDLFLGDYWSARISGGVAVFRAI